MLFFYFECLFLSTLVIVAAQRSNIVRNQKEYSDNDDYCDTVDGSDETKTSACAGRTQLLFSCENTTFVKQRIFASRVNDGICDCCDGSDEVIIECPKLCEAIGAAETRARDLRLEKLRNGQRKRNSILMDIKTNLEDLRSSLSSASVLLPRYDGFLKELRRDLEIEENLEKDELEKAVRASEATFDGELSKLLKELWKREMIISLIASIALRGKEDATEAIIAACAGKYEGEGDDPDDTEAIVLAMDSPDENDSRFFGNGGEAEEVQLEPSMEGSSTVIINAIPLPKNSIETMANALALRRISDVNISNILRVAIAQAQLKNILKHCFHDVGLDFALASSVPTSPVALRQGGIKRPQADELRAKVEQTEIRIKGIKQAAKKGDDVVGVDFGPDDFLYAFYGQCFTSTDKEYTYEVCPFKDAKQGRTKLGTYSKYEIVTRQRDASELPESHIFLYFQNGERCLGAADKRLRSMVVRLECEDLGDVRAKLEEVDEIEVCSYTAVLKTPIACI